VVRPCGILGGAFLPPAKEEHFAHQRQPEEPVRMRLKLVLAASLLAAIVGAGSCIALVLGVFARNALSNPGLLVTSTLLLPIVTITFASIFVYRHTARRRRLQAILTALLAILVTLAFLTAASIFSARRNRTEPPPPIGPHIAS
jgi:glucose-6-phosphate-specific signal transduction histidine kinase